jgi:hypothetical protein
MSYIIIKWSEAADLMKEEDFMENAFPIIDGKGRAKYGDGAFFVDEEWLEIYLRHKDETYEACESSDEQNSLSKEEISNIINTLKIEPNPYTGGEKCVFKVQEEYYYASRCYTADHGTECMIFPSNENGTVGDWIDVYASRQLSIKDSIKEFLENL